MKRFFLLLAVFCMMVSCKKEIEKPTVVTKDVESVAETSAVLKGSVSDDGGGEVTSRGFCYDENAGPTIDGSLTAGSGSGVGVFERTVENLKPNTTYYVRAYAINEAGVSYGDDKTFTTLKEKKLPTVTTRKIDDITSESAESGGEVTDDGNSEITARGVCWSMSKNPTIDDDKTTDGTGTGSFTSDLTDLKPDTKYYVRAYATNEVGTNYGEEISFITAEEAELAQVTTKDVTDVTATTAVGGGEVTDDGNGEVTARGVCWSTKENPTTKDSKTSNGDGLGSYSSKLTDLEPNTTYYIRAYAVNEAGTAYGKQKSFTTLGTDDNDDDDGNDDGNDDDGNDDGNDGGEVVAVLPTLTTNSVTSVTYNTAVTGGSITDDGGSLVTARGVCWSTSQNPTIDDNKTVDGAGAGSFTSQLSDLNPQTTYYVRAYATNEAGTAYGEELSFTTLEEIRIATVLTADITDITHNSAVSGGEVTDDGNGEVTARGVCWSTSQNPTIDDNKTVDGAGAGSFTSQLSDLEPQTTYYVRAYATNAAGTAYGSQYVFETEEEVMTSDETISVNGVTFTMIKVEGGTFQMGATSEQESDAYDDEYPVHSVTLSDYYIGETEVTQELWQAVMGSNPSYFSGNQRPVETVSWNDCKEFIEKLNQLTGKNFRLPTEAEWEYAARGGDKSQGYKYSGSNTIGDVAWYWDNGGEQTHDVKTKQPNELGIYDMSGNVWEWCEDWFGNYSNESQTNPTGPSSGSLRVLRGGSWGINARCCRVSYRYGSFPDSRGNCRGFRLVL